MKFQETSKLNSLNKLTYINLRWIAFIGQLGAVLIVQFFLQFKFYYLPCILIIFLGILTNIYLIFKVKENQLSNFSASVYLSYDIVQLGFLFYLSVYWIIKH